MAPEQHRFTAEQHLKVADGLISYGGREHLAQLRINAALAHLQFAQALGAQRGEDAADRNAEQD
jgi:hypothetical protein